MACVNNIAWCPTIFGMRCVKCREGDSGAVLTSTLPLPTPKPTPSDPTPSKLAPLKLTPSSSTPKPTARPLPSVGQLSPRREPTTPPQGIPPQINGGPSLLPILAPQAISLVVPTGQTVYRGDTRPLSELNSRFGSIFAAWVPLTLTQAREFVTATGLNQLRGLSFFGDIESGRICIPEDQFDTWSPGACMEWKIRSGSGNKRMCILSCEMSESCGGYANGNIYTMQFPNLRAVPWSTAIPGCKVPNKGTTPLLMMDAATVDAATIMAIKSPAMVYTKEIAFFTSIPTSYITNVRKV